MNLEEIVAGATYKGVSGRPRCVDGFMNMGNTARNASSAAEASVVVYHIKGSSNRKTLWSQSFADWAISRE